MPSTSTMHSARKVFTFHRCLSLFCVAAAIGSNACPDCNTSNKKVRFADVILPPVSPTDTAKRKHAFNLSDGKRRTAKHYSKRAAEFLHDSGASLHCINDPSLFHSIEDRKPNMERRYSMEWIP